MRLAAGLPKLPHLHAFAQTLLNLDACQTYKRSPGPTNALPGSLLSAWRPAYLPHCLPPLHLSVCLSVCAHLCVPVCLPPGPFQPCPTLPTPLPCALCAISPSVTNTHPCLTETELSYAQATRVPLHFTASTPPAATSRDEAAPSGWSARASQPLNTGHPNRDGTRQLEASSL
ncbi:hypothetical protein Vafri_14225 [Volvox africanus]|uniref:Uncharacterized protein n=1 Tax=Volvox africanus TaxID=51714 RepID=A0A8J4F3C5_9CHLO|nr:hypothetical protein Vafri_14225 [Volvox africanus]